MKSFFHATAMLVGMIVGVGLFAVPYVSAQAGFLVGLFWILILGAVSLYIHCVFGEVVAGTAGKHRLAGYAKHYIGRRAKQVVTISQTMAFWGAQLAYMLMGGMFLRAMLYGFDGGDSGFFTIGLFCFVGVITFFGIRLFERVEFYLTWGLILIIGAILLIGAPEVQMANLTGWNTGSAFVPYGIVLFALGGAPAIPEMWEIVRGKKRTLRAAIIAGTLISVAITLLFALVVVGISGTQTTADAFSGLSRVFDGNILRIGALFGFFAVITSYLVVATYLKEMFQYDFLVKRTPAWSFAVGVPVLLFATGAQNFVRILDILGSVFSGFDAIMIVAVSLAYFAKRRTRGRGWKTALGALVIILLAIGVAQKLLNIL